MAKQLKIVDGAISRYRGDRSFLIEMLLDIQQELGWLSKPVLQRLSQKLNIPLAQLYHIATFYRAFRLAPLVRHTIYVCTGLGCHIHGSDTMVSQVENELKIKSGETSTDGKFTLDTVSRLGCCALGAGLMVDGKHYIDPASSQIKQIIDSCD